MACYWGSPRTFSKKKITLLFTIADRIRVDESRCLCIFPSFFREEELSSILDLGVLIRAEALYFICPEGEFKPEWRMILNNYPRSCGAVTRLAELIDPKDPHSLFEELKETLNGLTGSSYFSLKNISRLLTAVTGAAIVILGPDKRQIFDNRESDAPACPFRDWADHLSKENSFAWTRHEEMLFSKGQSRWYGSIMMAYGSVSGYIFLQGVATMMAPDQLQRKLLRPYLLMARVGEINMPAHNRKRKDEFLYSLIYGLNMDSASIRKESEYYDMEHDVLRYIWILRLYGFDPEAHDIERIVRICETAFPDNMFLSERDQIVSIHIKDGASDETNSAKASRLMEKIEAKYQGVRCVVGNSRAYQNLIDLRLAYRDAMLSLRVGLSLFPDSKKFLTYNDLLLYHFISDQNDNPILRRLYGNSIRLLIQNDEDHNESLLQTLLMLVKSNFRISECAERMELHRNTLYQRMDKIKLLTGIDLKSQEGRLLMQLGVKMYQILTVESPSP